MKQVIGGKVYDTETGILVASDRYWDGNNFERHGRNQFLYKTKKGNVFVLITTLWVGERDKIIPVTKDEAKSLWSSSLIEHEMSYEEAFEETPEEA